jgi:tRNA(adenine34) deaminase
MLSKSETQSTNLYDRLSSNNYSIRLIKMELLDFEIKCFQRAIALAQAAEAEGNLPVGAVISLDQEIIGEGKSNIWTPQISLTRHAEMEAMRSIPPDLWHQAPRMSLYTTLEPCLMCLSAILLHRIGRVSFGSADPFGGASSVVDHLPPFFADQFSKLAWIGPAFPDLCDPLFIRLQTIEKQKRFY